MLNVNWEKIHSIILSVTCHGLRNFSPYNKWGDVYNIINNIICHLSWLNKLSPTHTHPLKTIREFLRPYELLFFELESLVKC